MIILGVETSCDETSIAVLKTDGDGFTMLANVVSSQIETHEPFGGVVPMLAAREHTRNIGPVFDVAVREAGLKNPGNDVDLIAVTRGPGLGPALLVGLTFARTLAMQWGKPVVGVNHMEGHIYSNWLPPNKFPVSDTQFPVLNLLVSGGHTELVLMRGHGVYERLGETQDDAVGEAFDKAARLLGLGYPGGPALSRLAVNGRSDAYALPRPMSKSGNLDFSYSGLKTAVLYLIRGLTPSGKVLDEQEKADIAASFQEAAVDVLIQKSRTAATTHKPKMLLLSGGVSANALLRKRITALGEELHIPVSVPDNAWTGDNAAMIAAAGYFNFIQKKTTAPRSWESVVMDANLRLGGTGAAS